jgi:hypothetical protein
VVLVASLSWCFAAGLTTSAADPTATLVRPAGHGLVAGSVMSRRWLLALRTRDGTVDAHFSKLAPDDRVNAVEPDGRGGWFIAGEFAGVGRVQCANLVHVYASGQVDRNWCPDPDGYEPASAEELIREARATLVRPSRQSVGSQANENPA